MIRTRMKFCGMRKEEDVRAAVAAGADAIGFVFFSKSRRSISIEQAKILRQDIPPFVDVVALFVNADPEYVQKVIEEVQPNILQFHGDEEPSECEQYGVRYMKAFRVGGPGMESRDEVLEACRRYDSAAAWLFDSYSANYGGSGEGFDLSLLGSVRNALDARSMVLAGGLDATNVADSIRRLRPFGVDVSSGIEREPGEKCPEKMEAFAAAVSAADLQLA
jgi:phosphoribosylanthranilate isomerase